MFSYFSDIYGFRYWFHLARTYFNFIFCSGSIIQDPARLIAGPSVTDYSYIQLFRVCQYVNSFGLNCTMVPPFIFNQSLLISAHNNSTIPFNGTVDLDFKNGSITVTVSSDETIISSYNSSAILPYENGDQELQSSSLMMPVLIGAFVFMALGYKCCMEKTIKKDTDKVRSSGLALVKRLKITPEMLDEASKNLRSVDGAKSRPSTGDKNLTGSPDLLPDGDHKLDPKEVADAIADLIDNAESGNDEALKMLEILDRNSPPLEGRISPGLGKLLNRNASAQGISHHETFDDVGLESEEEQAIYYGDSAAVSNLDYFTKPKNANTWESTRDSKTEENWYLVLAPRTSRSSSIESAT